MPTMRQRLCTTLMLGAVAATLVGTVAISRARAADIDGHPFADRIVRDATSLELRGLGRVYYLRIFEVYVGGLYLPTGVGSDRVLDDVPKRLELRYSRSVTSADFAQAADEFLRRNYDDATLAPLAARLARIHSLYRDVEAGDRYALTYLPDRGTELALNGKPVGVIPGADFARVYFGIWLGERPLSSRFKRAVLEGGAL